MADNLSGVQAYRGGGYKMVQDLVADNIRGTKKHTIQLSIRLVFFSKSGTLFQPKINGFRLVFSILLFIND